MEYAFSIIQVIIFSCGVSKFSSFAYKQRHRKLLPKNTALMDPHIELNLVSKDADKLCCLRHHRNVFSVFEMPLRFQFP